MTMPKISICIPTYNRSESLINCLSSIYTASKNYFGQFEVCVSDNGSDDDTRSVVNKASRYLNINYHRNEKNLGIPQNFINVVSMAKGEYVWLIGDDDLILPDTFDRLLPLLEENQGIDFFYLNSFHLDKSHINLYPHPFDTKNLPSEMEPFSKKKNSEELEFFELIDPKVSYDFLGGMFLSMFRKTKWDGAVDRLDSKAIKSSKTFSHFDNTFPHLKIWAHAFSSSQAYFNAAPMSVCITGYREWAPLYPLVRNIRLVEALDTYKENGMPYLQYIRCKNFVLNNYFSGVINMLIYRNIYDFKIGLLKHYLKCAFYPNVYLSIIYLFIRKIKMLKSKI
jgi:glycosyltransferase involved in cell wall biosynthesis